MNRRPMILYSGAVVGAMTVLSAWAWTQLPAGAQVPIHWGIDGRVDGYAPKELGLFMLPLTAAGIAGLLAVIPRFEPRRANLERSGKAYAAIWIAVVAARRRPCPVRRGRPRGGAGREPAHPDRGRGSCSSSSATTCRRSGRTT